MAEIVFPVKRYKAKLVMAGQCPHCGKEYARKPPVDAAACGNPDSILVPLKPTLVLSKREYAKFSAIAELAAMPLEDLVSELMEEAAKQKLEELKAFPSVVVTVKGLDVKV